MSRWDDNLCGRCRKRPKVPGYKLCEACLEQQRHTVQTRSWKPSEDHPWKKAWGFAANNRKKG